MSIKSKEKGNGTMDEKQKEKKKERKKLYQ